MGVLSVVGDLVHHHSGDKTLSISAGEDECYALEWCFFTSLVTPHPVTHEELVVAYNLAPASIQIKYDIIIIPHL